MRKLILLFLLSGCGIAMQQVEPQEQSRISSAVEPSSQAAAEKAVVDYFADRLVDPESARYKFLPYRRGYTIGGTFYDQERRFGVFMCGTVNAKNRMGGYTGQDTFIAFFFPYAPDKVVYGTMDSPSATGAASSPCSRLYG